MRTCNASICDLVRKLCRVEQTGQSRRAAMFIGAVLWRHGHLQECSERGIRRARLCTPQILHTTDHESCHLAAVAHPPATREDAICDLGSIKAAGLCTGQVGASSIGIRGFRLVLKQIDLHERPIVRPVAAGLRLL
jgi:hypothetical protein